MKKKKSNLIISSPFPLLFASSFLRIEINVWGASSFKDVIEERNILF